MKAKMNARIYVPVGTNDPDLVKLMHFLEDLGYFVQVLHLNAAPAVCVGYKWWSGGDIKQICEEATDYIHKCLKLGKYAKGDK